MIKYVVVEEELTLLLCRKAPEKMKLITVNYDKFQSVSGGGGGSPRSLNIALKREH